MVWHFGTETRGIGCQEFANKDEVYLSWCGTEARGGVGEQREGRYLSPVISISSCETEGFSEYTLKLGKASLLSSFGDVCCGCVSVYVASLFCPVTVAWVYLEQVMGEIKGLRWAFYWFWALHWLHCAIKLQFKILIPQKIIKAI